MPPQTQQSSLLAGLGKEFEQAVVAHANDETEYGRSDPPAGIENGVARLVDCRFAKVKEGPNAGKVMFMAAGVIVAPKSHAGVPVVGLRTSIIEPLYATPTRGRKDVAAHTVWILNELRKLGADPAKLTPRNLEPLCAELKRQQPHFRFRTWKGSKQVILKDSDGKWRLFNEDDKGKVSPSTNKGAWPTEEAARKANPNAGRDPLVNHQWNGVVEFTPEDEGGAAAGVEDETGGPEASTNGDGVDTAAAGGAEEFNEFEGGDVGAAEEGEEGAPAGDDAGEDLAALAEAADAKDKAAQKRLKEIALDAGVDEEEFNNADTFADTVALIEAARGGVEVPAEEEPEPEPEESVVLNKGDTGKYRPTKNGKPVLDAKKKPVAMDVEVLSVNKKAETYKLKSLVTQKPVAGDVPFDQVTPD